MCVVMYIGNWIASFFSVFVINYQLFPIFPLLDTKIMTSRFLNHWSQSSLRVSLKGSGLHGVTEPLMTLSSLWCLLLQSRENTPAVPLFLCHNPFMYCKDLHFSKYNASLYWFCNSLWLFWGQNTTLIFVWQAAHEKVVEAILSTMSKTI